MLDRVAGQQRDAVIGADPGALKEAADAAYQASKFPEGDCAAVFDRHDIGFVGMKSRGALDPLSDESGTGVVYRNIMHFFLYRDDWHCGSSRRRLSPERGPPARHPHPTLPR